MYWDHTASSDRELTVKNGMTVGLVENTTDDDLPPKGYRRVSQWTPIFMHLLMIQFYSYVCNEFDMGGYYFCCEYCIPTMNIVALAAGA